MNIVREYPFGNEDKPTVSPNADRKIEKHNMSAPNLS